MTATLPVHGPGGVIVAKTLVDAEDFDRYSRWKWTLIAKGYASRSSSVGGQHQTLLLHREILGLQKGDGKVADHINRDKLDNRRSNLRVVTYAQSAQNISAHGSGYRGVSRERDRWAATVGLDGNTFRLGSFLTELDAAAAAAQWRAEHMSHAIEDPALLAHEVERDYSRRNGNRSLDDHCISTIRKRYIAGESSRTRIARAVGVGKDQARAALCPNNYKDAPLFAEMMATRRERGDTMDEHRGLRKVRRAKVEAGEADLTTLGDLGRPMELAA